jgi:hypothetical protein
MPESEFTNEAMRRAAGLGLLAHHCNDPRRCAGPRGFVDTLIAGQHGVLFAEQKMPAGSTSAGQDLWLWTVHRAGRIAIAVWEPADFEPGGLVDQQLQAIV